MNNLFVKICGMTTSFDTLYACKCGVNAVGFIAYSKSKRFIENTEVVKIIKDMSENYDDVLKVGVFVNEKIEEIEKYIFSGINIVQLHGNETAEYIEKLKKISSGIQIWKAVRLKDKNEIIRVNEFDVDKILIDTYSANEYGGTGKVCDWGLAGNAVKIIDKPVILAGGLNPDNIREAINSVNPYGVDLSSGVEFSPGVKNHSLIKEVFNSINS